MARTKVTKDERVLLGRYGALRRRANECGDDAAAAAAARAALAAYRAVANRRRAADLLLEALDGGPTTVRAPQDAA